MKNHRSLVYFCALVLVFFLGYNQVWANSITISGKLKKLNRITRIASGKDGNAVVVWNYNKANNATYGKIYLVELNRQADGTWTAGEPIAVFNAGQRPSVAYLANFDQYLIVCDTGLTKMNDYLKSQNPTKILGRRYNPTFGASQEDNASSLTEIETLVDEGKLAIGSTLNYISYQDGYERLYLTFTDATITSGKNFSLKNIDRPPIPVEKFGWNGWVLDGYNGIAPKTYSMKVNYVQGAYFSTSGLVINGYIYLGGFKIIGCGDTRKTYCGLIESNLTNWKKEEHHFGYTPGTYIGKTYFVPVDGRFGVLSDFHGKDRLPTFWMLNLGLTKIQATYHLPKKDVENFKYVKFPINYSPDAAKKSDSYILFATKNGKVYSSNLALKGKPLKAQKIFKAKKNKFWHMDVTTMGDEVLMVYSEYSNNKKTKSAVKFRAFEVK